MGARPARYQTVAEKGIDRPFIAGVVPGLPTTPVDANTTTYLVGNDVLDAAHSGPHEPTGTPSNGWSGTEMTDPSARLRTTPAISSLR